MRMSSSFEASGTNTGFKVGLAGFKHVTHTIHEQPSRVGVKDAAFTYMLIINVSMLGGGQHMQCAVRVLRVSCIPGFNAQGAKW